MTQRRCPRGYIAGVLVSDAAYIGGGVVAVHRKVVRQAVPHRRRLVVGVDMVHVAVPKVVHTAVRIRYGIHRELYRIHSTRKQTVKYSLH